MALTVKTKIKKKAICLFSVIFLFFLIAGYNGPIIEPDSSSYIIMNKSREPIYPLFLAFFRGVFGGELYLYVVCIVQKLLAAFSITLLTVEVVRLFRLNNFSKYIITFLLTVPYWIELILYSVRN